MLFKPGIVWLNKLGGIALDLCYGSQVCKNEIDFNF